MLPLEGHPPGVTIVFGPRIETMTMSRPEALAVCGGRVIAEGSVADLVQCFPRAVTRVLDGALLVPGFNDAHLHPSFAAEQTLRVDLDPVRAPDRDRALALLRERAGQVPAGEWIIGAGYDVVHSPAPRLNRRSLDTVSARHPVYVVGSTWHAAVANSRALDIITADPGATGPGGTVSRGEDGELDGWLYELPHMRTAWSGSRIPSVLPELPRPALARALRALSRRPRGRPTSSCAGRAARPPARASRSGTRTATWSARCPWVPGSGTSGCGSRA
jgi:predicted amidohydrolase YtcJ